MPMVMTSAMLRLTANVAGVKADALAVKAGITTPDLTEAKAFLNTVRDELNEYAILRKHGHANSTAPSPTYLKITGFSIPADKVDAALAMFNG